MADCSTRNYTSVIDRTECIGNSLVTINNNFANLDQEICETSNRIDTLETNVGAIPTGAVMPFAGQTAPIGWLVCDGQDLNTYNYRLLHAYISNIYGGTSYFAGTTDQPGAITTFKIPDLRGYFVRGFGTTQGSAAFGQTQVDEVKQHTHPITASTTSFDGVHQHWYSDRNTRQDPGGGGGGGSSADGTGDLRRLTDFGGGHSHTVNVTLGNTGGSETRPKNIALLYCIKY